MAYTGRLRPKWVPFSGFRYIKGQGFNREVQVYPPPGTGFSVFEWEIACIFFWLCILSAVITALNKPPPLMFLLQVLPGMLDNATAIIFLFYSANLLILTRIIQMRSPQVGIIYGFRTLANSNSNSKSSLNKMHTV